MKIKYILIFVLCFFCLSVNVRATSIDFTCEYKNGNDTLKLIMSGDYDKGVSVSYALIINDASSIKIYPANFIQYFDNSYQILEGAGYVSGKYYTYACPKELYVAANNNNFVYQIVKYSYDLINGKYITAYTPIIFFSENGYKIEDGNITKTVVLLDEPITSNVLNIDSYTTKTFSIDSANSKNNTLVVPPSESDTENLQYCYYKNSCGEIIELKFYKNGNINQRNFSDGKKLMNWDNKNICPTSVKKLNENDSGYYGYSSSCSGSGSVKLCYDFLESSSNKKNIITEGNCSGLTDNSNDKTTKYVSYNSDDAPYIKVVISGNTYEYLYENKSSSSYTNVTFTTSNADGTINKSDAESQIKVGDYLKYIVCTDVYKNCRFSSEK